MAHKDNIIRRLQCLSINPSLLRGHTKALYKYPQDSDTWIQQDCFRNGHNDILSRRDCSDRNQLEGRMWMRHRCTKTVDLKLWALVPFTTIPNAAARVEWNMTADAHNNTFAQSKTIVKRLSDDVFKSNHSFWKKKQIILEKTLESNELILFN